MTLCLRSVKHPSGRSGIDSCDRPLFSGWIPRAWRSITSRCFIMFLAPQCASTTQHLETAAAPHGARKAITLQAKLWSMIGLRDSISAGIYALLHSLVWSGRGQVIYVQPIYVQPIHGLCCPRATRPLCRYESFAGSSFSVAMLMPWRGQSAVPGHLLLLLCVVLSSVEASRTLRRS